LKADFCSPSSDKRNVVILSEQPSIQGVPKITKVPFLGHYVKFSAVALDMRGYGDSDKPNGIKNYSMQNLIKDVRETIEKLGRKLFSIVNCKLFRAIFNHIGST
jgi:hypothetical protein